MSREHPIDEFPVAACSVCLDNIVIYLCILDKHIDYVLQMLTSLHEAQMTLNLKRCELFMNHIDYLGHVDRPGRL